MRRTRLLCAGLLSLGTACAATSGGTDAPTPLARYCAAKWEEDLALQPTYATRLNVARYHGDLEDVSHAAREDSGERLRTRVNELRAFDVATLSSMDRVTHALLLEMWATELAIFDLGIAPAEWNLNPRGGPQNEFLSLGAVQPTATAREREQLLERWSKMPAALAAHADNLTRGIARGRSASTTAVSRTLAQLERLLSTPVHASPLVEVALGGGTLAQSRAEQGVALGSDELWFFPAPRDPLAQAERMAFVRSVYELTRAQIYPAFERYADVVRNQVAPAARSDEQPGVCYLEDGAAYYELCIREHTSLELSAAEIHALGLREVARIRAEMSDLGERVFGTRDVTAIADRLRNDPKLHFNTAEEVEAKALECLQRATKAMPEYFGILPRAECEVVRVPEHEAPDTTIAYYNEPAPDGSRPGRYYINTYLPETRPRYDAEVLAFHEAIPGHHLQIAIAQELQGLPPQRRFEGSTAFIEGWALYTERLCDEIGLYSSDLDRLGILSFDAWRASRLVVDTGLHAFGWSRAQAIAYMRSNTLLAENNVENEIDRYISWPGQALGYKLGQLEILKLRAEAQARLGAAFTLSDFHDVVLRRGAVTLQVLRAEVERWLKR